MYTYYGLSAIGPNVAKHLPKKHLTIIQLVRELCFSLYLIANLLLQTHICFVRIVFVPSLKNCLAEKLFLEGEDQPQRKSLKSKYVDQVE